MVRFLLVLLSLVIAGPAAAHSLRVFAKVEDRQVSGYAFFIGGGRPAEAIWVAKMGDATLATGKTDEDGLYRFAAPTTVTTTIAITVDTGEGHVATTTLAPQRFGSAAKDQPGSGSPMAIERRPEVSQGVSQGTTTEQVEAAVERQVAPLLERIEVMDARMRFTDILSGIFLIVGLAGISLWARGRKS